MLFALTKRENPHRISPVNDLDGKKARESRPQRAGGWCKPVGEPVGYWSRSFPPEARVGRDGRPRYRPRPSGPQSAIRQRVAKTGWYRVFYAPGRIPARGFILPLRA